MSRKNKLLSQELLDSQNKSNTAESVGFSCRPCFGFEAHSPGWLQILRVAMDGLELLILHLCILGTGITGVPPLLVSSVLGIKSRTFFSASIFETKSHSDAKLA